MITEFNTLPKKIYYVQTAEACTVLDADGEPLAEISAPGGYFPGIGSADAATGTVTFSPAVKRVIGPFDLAPQLQLTLLGLLGGELPAGYTRLAYLESNGTQYIAVKDIQIDDDLGGRVDYVDFNPTRDAPMLSGTRMGDDIPRFYLPYTSNGTGYYGWDAWVNLGAYDNTRQRTVSLLNYFNDRQYKMSYGNKVLHGTLNAVMPIANNQFLTLYCYNPLMTSGRYVTGLVYSMQLTRSSVMVCSFVPVLDQAGTPCMFDLVTSKPFGNEGTGAFIAGVETQTQLNNLLRNLPDRSGLEVGTLQVRLAAEMQTPENEAKLDAMLAKNWEITQAA